MQILNLYFYHCHNYKLIDEQSFIVFGIWSLYNLFSSVTNKSHILSDQSSYAK